MIGPYSFVDYFEELPDQIRRSDHVYLLGEPVEEISTKLLSLTNLRSLNLWGNDIGEEGARAVAALTNLTSLDLADNGVGDEGARAIAALLQSTNIPSE